MINCLIIDDEPLAREVLEAYVQEISGLNLLGSCKNALEAKELMGRENVDLIFLDINMPEVSGISFYKTLVHKPKVIFTTAYPEYALEGFELAAVDYLLKPFSFERFEKAVTKFHKDALPDNDYILFKADKRIHKIDFKQILYFESIGDYVKVILEDSKNLIISDSLKKLEGKLPPDFTRIHKSYIISIPKLEYIEGNQIKLGDKKLPIGQSYREKLKEVLRKG
jgi:two-component system LytT family response regulator